MVARIFEWNVKQDKKDDFRQAVQSKIAPMLRQQSGFLEILSFFPEITREDNVFTISLWTMRADAEYYEKEFYPRMYGILKPYLLAPAIVRPYTVEGTLFEHFAEMLAA